MPSDRLPEIFVAHSHDETEAASEIVSHLRRAGLSAITDMTIEPGDQWSEDLTTSIEDADSYIVLVGDDPATSRDRRQWKSVLEAKWAHPEKPIVSLIVNDADVPPAFSEYESIRLTVSESGEIEDAQEIVPDIIPKLAGLSPPRPDLARNVRDRFFDRLDAIGELNRSYDESDDFFPEA